MSWLGRVLAPPAMFAALWLCWPSTTLADPDPRTATAVSVACTTIPLAAGLLIGEGHGHDEDVVIGATMIAAGVYLGPATGYWYGGIPGRGFAGVGYRLLLTGIPLAGGGMAMAASESGGGSSGEGLFWFGCVLVATQAVYDVATVGQKVRRNNAKHAISYAPWRAPDGAVGIALRMTF